MPKVSGGFFWETGNVRSQWDLFHNDVSCAPVSIRWMRWAKQTLCYNDCTHRIKVIQVLSNSSTTLRPIKISLYEFVPCGVVMESGITGFLNIPKCIGQHTCQGHEVSFCLDWRWICFARSIFYTGRISFGKRSVCTGVFQPFLQQKPDGNKRRQQSRYSQRISTLRVLVRFINAPLWLAQGFSPCAFVPGKCKARSLRLCFCPCCTCDRAYLFAILSFSRRKRHCSYFRMSFGTVSALEACGYIGFLVYSLFSCT